MKRRTRSLDANWEVSQESPIVTPRISQLGKRKLTKEFFRQLIEEDLPDSLSHAPDEKDYSSFENLFQDGELKDGQSIVLGWVNYFWPRIFDGYLVSKDGVWLGLTEEDLTCQLLHVLWKNGNNYRRILVADVEPVYPYLKKNLPQIFLGDYIEG